MAHLDLKRAALSVESAKQLTETINATSNNQGDIRFIHTLPRYSDLRLIEAAETAADCRQTENHAVVESPPSATEGRRTRTASHCRIQENDGSTFERTFTSIEGGGKVTSAVHARQ
jgi:hypothetical protein